jgi:hypothetical protein
VWVSAEHPLFTLYTSGSTGKPKGVQHASAGYLLGAMVSMQWIFDFKPDDVFWCTADVGWITGHTYVAYGPLAMGGTQVIFEGVPTYPDAGRFWKIIQNHRVSIFYTAPTAIRSLIKLGADLPAQYDLSSLRLLGSVGEPINPEANRDGQSHDCANTGGDCAQTGFLPKNDGEQSLWIGAGQRVVICVANPGRLDFNQYFACPGSGEIDFFDRKRLSGLPGNCCACFHGALSLYLRFLISGNRNLKFRKSSNGAAHRRISLRISAGSEAGVRILRIQHHQAVAIQNDPAPKLYTGNIFLASAGNRFLHQKKCQRLIDGADTHDALAKRCSKDKYFVSLDADIGIGTRIKAVVKAFQQTVFGVGGGKKLRKKLLGQGKNALFALIVRNQQNGTEAAIDLPGEDKISGIAELAAGSIGIDLRITHSKYSAKNPFLPIRVDFHAGHCFQAWFPVGLSTPDRIDYRSIGTDRIPGTGIENEITVTVKRLPQKLGIKPGLIKPGWPAVLPRGH